ncbi:Hypothetical protein CINCED_3A017370 [Cinara cedri]|uniref:Uncharacterized protein n=1 Tax=Cinara cedri TaxID=506608 RepID=A0A5E4NLM8_9HEMI|nr:Hypothetical protein CINCED_3A017370 [Cinara cedri]
MSSEQALFQEIRCLKDKLASKNEAICKLNEKLVAYDELVIKNSDLQTEFDKLKQWVEHIAKTENKTTEDMLKDLELQKQKLCESKLSESKLQTEIKKLHEDIESMKEQINNLKKIEQKYCMEIEDLETCKNRVLNDLSNTKIEIEEKCSMVECLRNQLKCKESKIYNIESQLDTCKTTCCQLREECTYLKSELDCKKTELATMKSHATMTEEKLKLDRDALSNEANAERKKVYTLEIEHSEAKRTITNNKVQIKKLDSLILELREASEKDRSEINNRIQKYKKELCAKDEVLGNMKNQIAELQHENDCMTSEINSVKTQLNDTECKLDKLKHETNEKIEQFEGEKQSMFRDFEEKKKSEVCALNGKINDLEEEICRNKEQLDKSCSPTSNYSSDAPPPTCSSGDTCESCQITPNSCQSPSLQYTQMSSKCTSGNSSQNNDLINELRQLYCGLQEVRQSAKMCMIKTE